MLSYVLSSYLIANVVKTIVIWNDFRSRKREKGTQPRLIRELLRMRYIMYQKYYLKTTLN